MLAPATVQEAIDLTVLAFDLAAKYRMLVFVVADGAIGQMMEPAEMPPMRALKRERPSWALTGAVDRDPNLVSSIHLGAVKMEAYNRELQQKLAVVEANEVRFAQLALEDAEWAIVAFGTAGRIAQTAVKLLRAEGLKVGLLRPITLWPFPEQALADLADQVQGLLVVEMNAGQMVHDVRAAVAGKAPVRFHGRMGGAMPLPEDIVSEVKSLAHVPNGVKVEGNHNGHLVR